VAAAGPTGDIASPLASGCLQPRAVGLVLLLDSSFFPNVLTTRPWRRESGFAIL